MQKYYDVAVVEKPQDEGLCYSEVIDLFQMLPMNSGIPYEVEGEFSSAMGFINTDIAEKLNYTYDNPKASTYPSYSKNEEGRTLYEYIKFILDDMNNETEDRTYTFTSGDVSVSIYIGRGE